MAPAQGQDALLRWNNGDVLPGTLLKSEPDTIRWSSPIFDDDLVVDTDVLESIVFPKQSVYPTEAFRVGTVSGDVFVADLVGSDEKAFLFSSQRSGKVRVNRDAIYSLNRRSNPNLVFDGAQYKNWHLILDGPVKDLSYRVFHIDEDWERDDPFPDLSLLTPRTQGSLAAGYLDLGLSGFPDVVSASLHFAMAFEGRFEISEAGQYRFNLYADDQARLFVDGGLVVEFLDNGRNPEAGGHTGIVTLDRGFHALRVEFLELGGEFKLAASFTDPDDRRHSLVGVNKTSSWSNGPGGYMQSDRKKNGVFTKIEIPEPFELELELNASASPRFVLALGMDIPGPESDESLRLETWEDELVVIQDKVFEPVMTLAEDQHDVRLRLEYAGDACELRVYDAAGQLLASIKGVQPATGKSGIFVRNRGDDLTVRRLSVYRRTHADMRQVFDAARARVHLMDGQVMYGRLHVAEGGAYVVDQTGACHDIDLAQIDRIARPGVAMAVTTSMTELNYADGAVVRGRVERINSAQMRLHTAFSDEPVTCALAGVSLLRFSASATEAAASGEEMDQLFTRAGRLCGWLSFDLAGSPLSWQMPGAVRPLRLAAACAVRVERSSQTVARGAPFDTDHFPHMLYLKNGEVIPCRILSYNKTALGFESPFVKQRTMPSRHVKAIEFDRSRHGQVDANTRSVTWDGRVEDLSLVVDSAKLERALTVPRFSRDNPPSHVLVARNGDLKRGRLLGLTTQSIEFESKWRKQIVPVDRAVRVVNVSKQEEEQNDTTDLRGQVRVCLEAGSIMLFEVLESRDGQLIGHSATYGDMAIPWDSIRDLNLGGLDKAAIRSVFKDWVVRPARDPVFGGSQGP